MVTSFATLWSADRQANGLSLRVTLVTSTGRRHLQLWRTQRLHLTTNLLTVQLKFKSPQKIYNIFCKCGLKCDRNITLNEQYMLNWKLAFDLIVISKLQDDVKADGVTTCSDYRGPPGGAVTRLQPVWKENWSLSDFTLKKDWNRFTDVEIRNTYFVHTHKKKWNHKVIPLCVSGTSWFQKERRKLVFLARLQSSSHNTAV